jgi:hypothetical protein
MRLLLRRGIVTTIATSRSRVQNGYDHRDQSPAARYVDRLCDRLVIAVRALDEVQRRTADPALRQLCVGALDRIAGVTPEVSSAT